MRCSSVVQHQLMKQWVVGSIPHGGPIELFSHSSWCYTTCVTKGHGMCYPVCGMVHIKYPLLLIKKSSPCLVPLFGVSLGWLCGSYCRVFMKVTSRECADQQLVTLFPSLCSISRSSQCSTTGITKVMVCAILSMGWCI